MIVGTLHVQKLKRPILKFSIKNSPKYFTAPPALIVSMVQASLLEENIKPRAKLPPLLVPLRERRPEKLHYFGVSFGLTLDLFRFWKKQNFAPFYIAHIPVKFLTFL